MFIPGPNFMALLTAEILCLRSQFSAYATSLPWAARRITLALRTSLTPGRETPIRVFDWLSYTRKIWNAVRLQKALYAETRAYKDVRIHFFCHATLNAKASLWLLLHTAHPACARLTPNTERINHRTNCNIPYIWIFWSYTSRGYDRARHAGKKWRGEIDHPWERGYRLRASFCASHVSVECLGTWSTHAQKPKFATNLEIRLP